MPKLQKMDFQIKIDISTHSGTQTNRYYHENNVPSRLSPQWFCGNSCTVLMQMYTNLLICFLNEKALIYLLCFDAWHIAFVSLSSLKKNCQFLKSWKMSQKLLHLRSIQCFAIHITGTDREKAKIRIRLQSWTKYLQTFS